MIIDYLTLRDSLKFELQAFRNIINVRILVYQHLVQLLLLTITQQIPVRILTSLMCL